MNLLNLQTGKAETPDNPLDAIAAGTHVPVGGRVLVDPSGQLVVSPDSDVPANLGRYGYKVPTQPQLDEAAKQAKYGEGSANELRAGLEGAARGATFGASDVAERALGVDPEAIRERRKRNPVAALGGELAGAVGSAVMAPEMSPVGLATKGAGAISRALEAGALPEGANLAAKVLSHAQDIGAKALGSSVEGALFGAGENVTEAALGDPDLNAEKVMANLGYGALMGGALGAGAGVFGKLVPPAVGKARDAVQGGWRTLFGGEIPGPEPVLKDAELAMPPPPESQPQVMQATGTDGAPLQAGTEPPPNMPEMAPQDIAASPAAEVPPVTTPNPTPNPETGLPSPLQLGHVDGVIPRLVAKFTEAAGGPSQEETLAAFRNRGQAPAGKVLGDEEFQKLTGQLVDAAQKVYDAHSDMMQEAISKVRPQEIDSLLEGASPAPAKAQFDGLKDVLRKTVNEMRNEPDLYPARFAREMELSLDAMEQGEKPDMTAAEYFHEINRAKQVLDSKAGWGKDLTGASAKAESLWRDTVGSFRHALEDETVWGQAGARQAAFNDAFSSWKNLTGKGSAFRKYFMEKVGGEYRINYNKVRGYLNRVNTAEGQAKTSVLQDVFKTAARGIDETEKTYRAAPFEDFDAAGQRDFLAKQQALFEGAQGVIKGQPGMGFGGPSNLLRLMMLGHFGSPVALASELGRMAANPAALATLEKTAGKTTNAVGMAVKALFRPLSENAAKASKILRDQLTPTEKVERYKKRVDELRKLSGDPEAMIDRLHEATRDGFDAAPRTMQAMQLSALRGTMFLASKIPPEKPQLPFDRPKEPRGDEVAKFDRYFDAVHNPLKVLDELKAGRLLPETQETLAEVYPKLNDEIKKELLSEVTSRMAKGDRSLPYQTRLTLSRFLGSPLDQSMVPSQMLTVQQAMSGLTAQQTAQASSLKPMRKTDLTLASRIETDQQQAASRKA